jgi:hypothetical protein
MSTTTITTPKNIYDAERQNNIIIPIALGILIPAAIMLIVWITSNNCLNYSK